MTNMKLVHYSDAPITTLREPNNPQQVNSKPRGLWISDDADLENNWRSWCLSEQFNHQNLTHEHDVTLNQNANVMVLRSAFEIDAFHREFSRGYSWQSDRQSRAIDWPMVAERYDGIIITPYIWDRRLDGEASNWYYGWDCASGCIWRPRAIAAITLRHILDEHEAKGDPFSPGAPRMLDAEQYDYVG